MIISPAHLIKLSGGEQAKVRLCKLMMNESNWILFDEPTNHLGYSAKEELKRAMKELQRYNCASQPA